MKVDVIQECDRTHCQNIIAWFTALHQSLSVTDSLLPLLRVCLPACHHRPTFSVRVYDLCLYGFLIRINELCLSSKFSTAEYHLLMCNLLNCTVLGSLGTSCGNELTVLRKQHNFWKSPADHTYQRYLGIVLTCHFALFSKSGPDSPPADTVQESRSFSVVHWGWFEASRQEDGGGKHKFKMWECTASFPFFGFFPNFRTTLRDVLIPAACHASFISQG